MINDIVHRSKIGLEILIPLIVVLGAVMTVMVLHIIWIGIIVCGLLAGFLLNIYTSTTYTITGKERLIVKCGFLETFDININEIEWIKNTHDLSNGPALSIDRLEINYKGGRILISPRKKNQFIADLRKINPKI